MGFLAGQAQPIVLLPLTSEGRILGLLGCVVPSEELHRITFLRTLAQQACAAIDSDQLQSEARRWQQWLEAVFERMAEGVFVYDRDGMLALMDAAHELRTPLTTMRGNLDLLQREPPLADAERRDVLADLIAETERVSRLVDDLLTLASADAGRPLQLQRVPMAPLLDVLCRQAAVLAPDRTLSCHSGPDLAVIGDPDALQQVLLILLDNALKFSAPGSTVTVTTDVHGPEVALGIQDSGPGIAPEMLPRIFERFAQGDEARAARGSRLGLAIAKALIDGQKGTLTVETRVGAGSLFTVTLPRGT
jgi:signal transduction histidine kinase